MSENKIIEQEVEKKFNQLLERIPDILKNQEKRDEKDFFNFSIIELYQNTMQTMIDIINDVIHVFDNYNSNYLKTFMYIFFHEKRLFYIGIILIILSFVIYFIDGATI